MTRPLSLGVGAASLPRRVERRELAVVGLRPQTVCAILLALTLVRGVVAAFVPLSDDEAYYRLWALAPALSYLDHPPMVGWMMAGGIWLAGDTEFGLRLPSVVASLWGTLAIWRIAHLLISPRAGVMAAVVASAMPLLGVGAIVTTPDTPSVLFMILSLWALAELHVSRAANWLLLVGIFAGLGLLSKYTNLFLGPAIVLWLLLRPENRRYFRSWQLYVAGAISVALFTPVVWWNIAHGGASFAKQFSRVADVSGFGLKWQLELFGGYLLLASPVIAVLAVLGLFKSSRAARSADGGGHALLVLAVLPMLIYFFQHAFHGRVQANWPAPIYPVVAILAAFALDRMPETKLRRTLILALATGGAMTALIYVHALRPLHVDAGLREPTHQLRGWKQLADEVERDSLRTGAKWIATTSYATTGQLAFHLRGRLPVVQLDERLRYMHLPEPSTQLLSEPGLYVELVRRGRPDLVRSRFASVTVLPAGTRRYGDVELARYLILGFREPSGPILGPAGHAPKTVGALAHQGKPTSPSDKP